MQRSVSALAGSLESQSRAINGSPGSASVKKRRHRDSGVRVVEELFQRRAILELRRPDRGDRAVPKNHALGCIIGGG